ncbi:MAG: plasmid pRiA4b ORF-3 family protein [Candidatus Eremiobacteraeota bacterium]|nr:plasmid pRiA4b ORF-3 family protein [Candidatus Eremiobacteraeota bacterium]MBC5802752.1 plasmid pRiA4b ORF-3 family protein [Candidatus Eremiobacteraeota bacterium]MBC5821299.1 plasmid pRiA4b ORF-3 family protein [Candidatus Eremiobacteraeota bacterium]
MDVYLDRALEQVEAAATLTLAATDDTQSAPQRKAGRTRAASGAEGRSVAPVTAYRLKITLRGTKPPVWRRILVPSSTTLPKLHRIFQAAMGWTDSHLHAFRVGDIQYGTPDPEFGAGMRSERSVRLADIARAVRARFVYWYDFGDDWTHDVLVEDVRPIDEGVKLPTCLDGKRACPPEDVGGVYGYVQFLEAYRDPRHEEHERMREWAGPDFDADSFDRAQTAHELERLKI